MVYFFCKISNNKIKQKLIDFENNKGKIVKISNCREGLIMDFDSFTVQLFEESKILLEKAKSVSDDNTKETFFAILIIKVPCWGF